MRLGPLLRPVLPAGIYRRAVALKRRAERGLWAFNNEVIRSVAIRHCGSFRVALRVGTADEHVLWDSFDKDMNFSSANYEPGPRDTILDVGAHIGTFAMLAASKVPQGRVFAIEASRESFDLLCINRAMNGLSNIEVAHLALSDGAGVATLYLDPAGNWGNSITATMSRRSERVPTESLDGFMGARGIERIDFIKFNCEGAEFPVLMSASTETLARIKRMLVLYHCNLARGHDLDALKSRLRGAGFLLETTATSVDGGCIVAKRD
jgi:FkbM family methyltransferase